MDAAIRQLVQRRARDRCEYCQLPQTAVEARFHVEHILASQHQPNEPDDSTNLALACSRCNLQKGPNLSSIDPLTSEIVSLFHPRRSAWHEHFALVDSEIVGLTACGRATVQLLQMNARRRVELRASLIANGEF